MSKSISLPQCKHALPSKKDKHCICAIGQFNGEPWLAACRQLCQCFQGVNDLEPRGDCESQKTTKRVSGAASLRSVNKVNINVTPLNVDDPRVSASRDICKSCEHFNKFLDDGKTIINCLKKKCVSCNGNLSILLSRCPIGKWDNTKPS